MRKFGIEIEVASSLRPADFIRRATEAGVELQDMSHTHAGHSHTAWVVKRDGSLSGIGNGLRGYEFVSPPLDFDNPSDREQVNLIASVLQQTCRPIEQGGVHVHIEAVNEDGTNMTGKQVASVVRFFYKFEDAIYRIASSGWETLRSGARTYAKALPEEVVREMTKATTPEDVRRVWDNGSLRGRGNRSYWGEVMDRYYALNLRSYFLRNTIEFRCFNSTCNGDRMQAYIALCMAIVQDARHGHARYVGKNYPLGAMQRGEVTEQALMLRLQQVLRTKGRDTHVLMSEADWKNLRKTCWRDSRPQADIFGRRAA